MDLKNLMSDLQGTKEQKKINLKSVMKKNVSTYTMDELNMMTEQWYPWKLIQTFLFIQQDFQFIFIYYIKRSCLTIA